MEYHDFNILTLTKAPAIKFGAYYFGGELNMRKTYTAEEKRDYFRKQMEDLKGGIEDKIRDFDRATCKQDRGDE